LDLGFCKDKVYRRQTFEHRIFAEA